MQATTSQTLTHPRALIEGHDLRLYHDGALHVHTLCGRTVQRSTLSNWARDGYPVKKRLGVYVRFPTEHKAGYVYTTRETLDEWWREVMRRSAKAGVVVNDPFASKKGGRA